MKPKRHTIKPRGILSSQEVLRTERLVKRALLLRSPARETVFAYIVEEKMPVLIRHAKNMMDIAPEEGI